ncbi:MAG: 6-hydroxymethylpterin diphosphokinase MptE-like protein, partial [Gemmatimonadota bacterium]|nr:6-hydroxymethylpterin diphosphokinase MptE-like protein [Gemmatimonadota bacterium]
MDYFRKNMDVLQRVNPSLARRMGSVQAASAEIIPTGAGVPSVRLSDAGGRAFTLHSTVNPPGEAGRLVEAQYKEHSNVFLVYGFGLGYHVDNLVERLPGGAAALVVEPQASIFRLALSVRDLTHLLTHEGLFWAVGESVHEAPVHFSEVFRVSSIEGVSIIAHNPSVKLCGDYFNILDELCRKWIITVGGNFLTNVSSVKTYLANTLENIQAIVENPPIKRLFGRFRKVPGIVISAGPSLDKNIGMLRILENHAVLICVDTALGPLYRSGVKPHLAVAGDPSENNYRHLEGLGPTGAALVAEPMTHPRIVSEFQGDKFIMSFDEALMKNLSGILGDFGRVKAWGSISTGAFDLARRLGCDPIVFVGQDLSFTGGRYYAHGTYGEIRWLRDLEYPKTLDDIHKWRMSKENDLDVKDIFGSTLRTSKALEAYRHYLEREIENTDALVINATEGGVGFRGVENVPLEEVLWNHARDMRPVRSLIRKAHAGRTRKEKVRLMNFLEQTAQKLDKVCSSCNRGFEHARLIHQDSCEEPKDLYREIERIYEEIYNERDVLKMLENANQAGLLTFQRGAEKLKGRKFDEGVINEAARLYGSFFTSFYQTASPLKDRFERAATAVEL